MSFYTYVLFRGDCVVAAGPLGEAKPNEALVHAAKIRQAHLNCTGFQVWNGTLLVGGIRNSGSSPLAQY